METLTYQHPTLSHEDSLPTIPFDLVVEILCRLPVKFILQFRSVCKLWNSLISDLKFAKKHLHLSATHSLNSVCYSGYVRKYSFESRPLDSLFSTYAKVTQIEYPPKGFDGGYRNVTYYYIVGSCNGILCFGHSNDDCFVLVWNPSIRQFKELPPYEKPKSHDHIMMTYGFGYDHVNDTYKVVVVLRYRGPRQGSEVFSIFKTQVKVYTFATNIWKSIGEFPLGCIPVGRSGIFVSGAINWLASKCMFRESPCLIVSFNLLNESYQEILQPDYGEVDARMLNLGVLRDCLCMSTGYDVWLMKEYGNKESWTKLLTFSYMENHNNFLTRAIYMSADDQVLLESFLNDDRKLIVYDLKTCTFKITNFQYKNASYKRDLILDVCTESLILP